MSMHEGLIAKLSMGVLGLGMLASGGDAGAANWVRVNSTCEVDMHTLNESICPSCTYEKASGFIAARGNGKYGCYSACRDWMYQISFPYSETGVIYRSWMFAGYSNGEAYCWKSSRSDQLADCAKYNTSTKFVDCN
jgi:hypothetical protein